MSKRMRNEVNYQQQLKQEAEEEDDKIKKMIEKIFAPVTWCRLKSGFMIQDLREDRFNEVLEMIKAEYIPFEVLCRNSEMMDDPVSLKSYLDHIMFTMRDESSIIALDENNYNALAGALLLRVANKAEYDRVFSRVILNDGEARRKCLEMTTALNRQVDIFTLCNCDTFLRYYLLCIKRSYRKSKVGYQLMRIGLEVARSFDINVVSGIFTSFSLQRCAKRLDFQLIQEISYINWRDKNNELIFSDPGAGNYTCALMVCNVVPDPPEDPLVIKKQAPHELKVVEPPKTRLEKRAVHNRSLT